MTHILLSECTEPISVESLPAHTVCTISKSCSGVKCCTDVNLLNTSVQTEIDVDRCRGKVFIGIEKLKVTILLTQFEFSKWHRETIQNVFSIE